MAKQTISISLQLLPELDPSKVNVILGALKRSLGDLGKDIQLLDGDEIAREIKKIDDELAKQAKSFEEVNNEADNLVQSLTGVESKAGLLTKAFKFNQITQGITTAANALQSFTSPFVDLDKQIKNIGTLAPAFEGQALSMDVFQEKIVELSRTVPDAAANLGSGVYNAISAGIQGSEDEIVGFVEVASKAAVAGVSDTNTAVNAMTSVMNAYNIKTEQAASVSDTFFAGIKLGKTSFEEMAAGLANVIPAASAAGVQFDEVTATIAQMTALGVPTAQATTQIRSAIIELQKPGGDLKKVFEEAGLSAETMADTLKSQGLIATLQQVEGAAAGMGKSLTQVFSSSEAASAALLVTGENAARATATLESVRSEVEAGVSTAAYDTAAQGIEVKTRILANKVQAFFSDAFSAVGDSFVTGLNAVSEISPSLTGLAALGTFIPTGAIDSAKEKLQDFGKGLDLSTAQSKLKGFGESFKSLPGVLENAKGKILDFGKAAAKGVTLNPKQILTYATTLVSTLVPSFGATAAAGTAASGAIGTGFAAALAPLAPLILGVTAVGAAFAYLYNTNDEFAGAVDEIWGGITNAVDQILGLLASAGSAIGDLFSAGIEVALIPFNVLWDVVTGLTEAVFGVAVPFGDVSGAVEFFGGIVTGLVDKAQLFIDVTKAIIAGVRGMIEVFTSNLGGGIVDLLTGNFSGAIDKFTSIGSDAGAAFMDGANASINQSQFENISAKLEDQLAGAEELSVQIGANADFGNLISEYESLSSQIDNIELIPESQRTAEEVAKLETLRTKAQEVANQIGETNSAAITSTKSTIDEATGQLVTSYDISISKARELFDAQRSASGGELAAAQEEYSAKLATTVALYEQQKERLKEMQAEATALAEAGDTEDYEKKIEEIKKYGEQVTANQEEVQKLLNEGSKAGVIDVPTTVLAKQSLGIEVDIEEERAKESLKKLETILNDVGVTYEPQINLEKAIEQYDTLQTRLDELKGKQDSGSLTAGEQAELDELTRKVEIAGKAIGRMAPEARGNIEFIKDANGNLVESFDINIDKAKEFAETQRASLEAADTSTAEYSASLGEIVDIYKAQKAELSSLEQQIEKAMQAGDTTKARELQAEYNKLNNQVQDFGSELAKSYDIGQNEGVVTKEIQEEVREVFGKTDEEIAEMVATQEGFTKEVEATADAATSLGDAFAASVKAAQETQKAAISELAGIDNALKEARAAGDKERVAALQEQRKEQLALAKDATAEIKNSEAINENLQYEIGAKKRKVDLGESALTIAKRELDIVNKQIQAEADRVTHQREIDRLLSGRAKNQFDELAALDISNETLQKQIEEVKNKYQLEFDADGNAIGVGLALRKGEKEEEVLREALDKIQGFNNQLARNEESFLKIGAELNQSEFEKLERSIATRAENLEIRINKPFVIEEDAIAQTISSLEENEREIAEAIKKTQQSLLDFAADNDLEGGFNFEDLTNEQKAILTELEKEEEKFNALSLENQAKLTQARTELYQNDLKKLDDAGQARIDELNKQFEAEKEALDLINSLTTESFDRSISEEETSRSDAYEREVDRINQLKENEFLSEAAHKKKLQSLEEEHNAEMEKLAKKRELVEQVNRGFAIESERQKQNAILEAERESLQERLALAEQQGDTETANRLSEELKGIQDIIAERGGIVTQYAKALQTDITDTFSNIGDPESLKEGFRNIFGVIAGGLKQQASAAVTSMILGQLSKLGATTGVLGLIAVPAITGLVNAAINAILNPILSGLTSFATGGRVDEPTLAIVGDKSKATGGSDNTEWVLHDTHIAQIIAKHDEAIGRWVGGLVNHIDYGRKLDRKLILDGMKQNAGSDMPAGQSLKLDDVLLRHTMNTVAAEIKRLTPELRRLGMPGAQYYDSLQKTMVIQKEYITENRSPDWFNTKMKEIRVPRYAFGSPALTSPQLAIVGDNPREAERVATDSQLIEMMEMVAVKSNEKLIPKMDELIGAIHTLPMKVHVLPNEVKRAIDDITRRDTKKKR